MQSRIRAAAGAVYRRARVVNGSISISAAAATVSGTTITVTATSSGDLSAAVFGVEYSILDNGGSLTGYTFSKNVVGAVQDQEITLTAGDGVTADSTVTVRAYYNLDVLDDPSTRVYANDIVPYVVAGGVPSGTQTEGETLTQVQGVIAGSSPLTVTYQWQNDGGTGTWANILGATSATYELQASDVGDDVAVVHTGTNTAGADFERSAETGPIASGYAPEAQAVIDQWKVNTPSLSTGWQDAINDLVVAAQANGWWTAADVIHVYASDVTANKGFNWKDPTGTAATFTGTTTFTAKEGVAGNGSTGWIGSGLTGGSLVNYAQNSACHAVYVRTWGAGSLLGQQAQTNQRFTSAGALKVNSSSNSTPTASNNAGLKAAVRRAASGAGATEAFGATVGNNVVSMGAFTTTSDAINNSEFSIFRDQTGISGTHQISFWWIGSSSVSATSGETTILSAMRADVEAFLTAVSGL